MNIDIIKNKLMFFENTKIDEFEQFRKSQSYGFLNIKSNIIIPSLLHDNIFKNKFIRNINNSMIENIKSKIDKLDENIFNMLFGTIYYNGLLFNSKFFTSINRLNFLKGFLNKAFLLNIIFEDCDFTSVRFINNNFNNCKFINCNFYNSEFIENVISNCIFTNCDFEESKWGIYNDKFYSNYKNIINNTTQFNSSYLTARGYGKAVFYDIEINNILDNTNKYWTHKTIKNLINMPIVKEN